jgi:methylated-DNA-[protein]-cysteine S-methyltransferase
MDAMRHRVVDSPLGPLTFVVDDDGAVVRIAMAGQRHLPDAATFGPRDDTVAEEAVAQLAEYFAGERTDFDFPAAPRGTEFQRRVWEALAEIPFGETTTYATIAKRLGSPTATRAVGAAIGRNPLLVTAPCHRVVGASGDLTGYAGGLDAKRWLLAHEQR